MTPTEALRQCRDALHNLRKAYVRLLENGRERITQLGGECDPVDVMEAFDPDLRIAVSAIAAADAALAAPVDEREAFEAWCKRGNINTALMMSSAFPAGTYADSRTDAAWHVWQARASLAAPPAEADEQANDLFRLQQDITRSKNLLVRLWGKYPAARPMIEGATGSWFVWGVDRDAEPAAPPTPAQPAAPVQAVPLTEDDVWHSIDIMQVNSRAGLSKRWLMELVGAVERAHGIGAST